MLLVREGVCAIEYAVLNYNGCRLSGLSPSYYW